jgi:hypothetical protein
VWCGIISESLVQHLAAEGINLPPTVVQRGIDSYYLHMDVGSVRIETPLHEMRIAAVHRGAGPRGAKLPLRFRGFDGYLLELAEAKGANCVIVGTVGKDLDAKCGTVELQASSRIGGDADVYAGQIGLHGAIDGDLSAQGGQIELSGSVGNL